MPRIVRTILFLALIGVAYGLSAEPDPAWDVPDTRRIADSTMGVLRDGQLSTQQKISKLTALRDSLPDDAFRMPYEYRMLIATLQYSPIPTKQALRDRSEIAMAVFSGFLDDYDHASFSGSTSRSTWAPRCRCWRRHGCLNTPARMWPSECPACSG